jgi:ankyrin repeat protein
MSLTGIKDVDREILLKLDDKGLLKICSIDKKTWNSVCDDAFLRRRLLKYPGIEINKLNEESWKQFFLKAIYYISRMREKYYYEYNSGNFKTQYEIIRSAKKNYINETEIMNSILFNAAMEGELPLIVWSLKNGANIHFNNDSAIRFASANGNLEIVKYLIENGSLPNGLFAASANGNLEIVKYLVERGANIRENNDEALVAAIKEGYLEILKYLFEQYPKEDGELYRYILSLGLIESTLFGQLEMVKYFIEQGADVQSYDNLALAKAVYNLDIIKYLIENGADIHTRDEYLLIINSRDGIFKTVKYLVENGADIHTQNDQALNYASENGHLEIIKYLVEHGANIKLAFIKKAKYKRHYEVVKYLESKFK